MSYALEFLAKAGFDLFCLACYAVPNPRPEFRHACEEILHGLPFLGNPSREASPKLLASLRLGEEPRKASDRSRDGGNAKQDGVCRNQAGERSPTGRELAAKGRCQAARLLGDAAEARCRRAYSAAALAELAREGSEAARNVLERLADLNAFLERLADAGCKTAERDRPQSNVGGHVLLLRR